MKKLYYLPWNTNALGYCSLVRFFIYLNNSKYYVECLSTVLKFHILACGCDTQGSTKESCSSNGMCTCKTNVDGRTCDLCQSNYTIRPFPDCTGEHYMIN